MIKKQGSTRLALTISFFCKKYGIKRSESGWINGGFFVCEPQIFDFIPNDATIWEREPLEAIAKANQLSAFKHEGFWKPMDSLKDKQDLNKYWEDGKAEWKLW